MPERFEIVGREAELAAVVRLLETEPPCALVMEGEAGIGKTTLWRAAVEQAVNRGHLILACAPAESEARLPFSALGDLLGDVLDGVLPALPEPQRAALQMALHEAAPAEPFDQLAVARSVVTAIGALARDGAALVAVDDVQWLDAPTARALEFATRRLGDAPVRLLVARRSDEDASLPLGLDRALPPGRITRLRVPPLEAHDLDLLLRERLDLRLPRPALVQLAHITAGNPYYSLEIARGFAGGGELTVPSSLADAIASRLEDVPAPARRTLLLAAASVYPTADLVERAEHGDGGLAAAMASGLLHIDGGRLRFGHPLLASVTYERALPRERRDAHMSLAAAADAGSEERAVHLARSHETPGETIAAELERVAESAVARGGPGLAAELAEAAARLTEPEDEPARRRRLVRAAEYHEAEGDPARGRALLEQLVAEMRPGRERAALLRRLADMSEGSPLDELTRICEQALAEAEGDPSLTAEIHTTLAAFTWIAGHLERSLEHSRAAVRYAEEAGDETRLAIAIGDACNSEALLALPWSRDAMTHALEIEQRVDELPPWVRPSYQRAVIAVVTDELDTAGPLLAAELQRARRLGNEPGVLHVLLRVADLELRTGRWSEALRVAREAHALARQGGLDVEEATAAAALALVLAHLGELDEARSLAEAAYRVSDRRGHRGLATRSAGVLGFVELSAARPDAALDWLTPAGEELRSIGMGELSISGVVQNELEALAAVGRLDEAEAVVVFVEEKSRPAGRSWHRAVAARGRALVASARGDVVTAREATAEALTVHESLPQPFELTRTLLVAGAVERRAKRWAVARRHYTAALELLDDLGAARWAELAAGELARLPGRRPRGVELTETERRIAELVADGLANKEVAARMFVSVRTVEANLTRVYAKLGVRSRTELARKLFS
jgi:DNA-binding CsgD family transcriptional regulator